MEYPRLVAIETTNRCNATCSFCPNSALRRGRSVMDDDLFEKIIADCTRFPLVAIEPFLQGEPFVDPRIFDRLELIRRRLPRTKLRLYSNGAALLPEKADRLRGLGVDHLYVSLNSTDPEVYRRTIGLPYERTLANLRHLARPVGGRPVARRLTVRMTITDETTPEDRRRFRALCRELGARPMISPRFNYKGDVRSDLPVPGYPCEHITRVDVLVDGRTTLCCMDQEGAYGWGSVRERSVLEIYQGREARRVRDLHRGGRRAQCEPCGSCNLFWSDCRGVPAPRRLRFWSQIAAYHLRHRLLV
jgi:pyruvate-formate lyase-activating enzyme